MANSIAAALLLTLVTHVSGLNLVNTDPDLQLEVNGQILTFESTSLWNLLRCLCDDDTTLCEAEVDASGNVAMTTNVNTSSACRVQAVDKVCTFRQSAIFLYTNWNVGGTLRCTYVSQSHSCVSQMSVISPLLTAVQCVPLMWLSSQRISIANVSLHVRSLPCENQCLPSFTYHPMGLGSTKSIISSSRSSTQVTTTNVATFRLTSPKPPTTRFSNFSAMAFTTKRPTSFLRPINTSASALSSLSKKLNTTSRYLYILQTTTQLHTSMITNHKDEDDSDENNLGLTLGLTFSLVILLLLLVIIFICMRFKWSKKTKRSTSPKEQTRYFSNGLYEVDKSRNLQRCQSSFTLNTTNGTEDIYTEIDYCGVTNSSRPKDAGQDRSGHFNVYFPDSMLTESSTDGAYVLKSPSNIYDNNHILCQNNI